MRTNQAKMEMLSTLLSIFAKRQMEIREIGQATAVREEHFSERRLGSCVHHWSQMVVHYYTSGLQEDFR